MSLTSKQMNKKENQQNDESTKGVQRHRKGSGCLHKGFSSVLRVREAALLALTFDHAAYTRGSDSVSIQDVGANIFLLDVFTITQWTRIIYIINFPYTNQFIYSSIY